MGIAAAATDCAVGIQEPEVSPETKCGDRRARALIRRHFDRVGERAAAIDVRRITFRASIQ